MKNITIVKVGGAVVEDEARLEALLDDFAALEGPKMLVHGGGRRATKVAEALGVESRMVNGRRVTGKDMLDVVTMVYGGLINKDIVARLQARGVNAAGLSGADMDVIRSVRRPVTDGVDFGFVGDVRHVGADRLKMLIDAGITPVLAPLTHDGHGSMLNTNADTIASSAATALVEYYDVTLVFCFENDPERSDGIVSGAQDSIGICMPGLVRHYYDKDYSVIGRIAREDYVRYVADGTISGGMMPKIENALNAVDAGVKQVVITLATEIGRHSGTVISK